MRKTSLFLILVMLICVMAACTPEKENCNIVTVTITDRQEDPAMHEPAFISDILLFESLWFSENEDKQIRVPMYDREIFWLKGADYDIELPFYQYRENDGNELEFTLDSVSVTLNGRIISVAFDGRPASDLFLQSLSDDEIRHIRFLYIEFDSIPGNLTQIDRVARINPGVGIIASGLGITLALERFEPGFLCAGMGMESDVAGAVDRICREESLESLITEWIGMADLSRILALPHLKILITCLTDYDPNVKLPENSKLEILCMNSMEYCEFELKNVDFLASLKNLKQVTLITSPDSIDLSSLSKLGELESVYLLGDQDGDLSVLNDLLSLKRISFPANASQREFNEFISLHTGLNSIALLGCDSITDLGRLHELEDLEVLIITHKDTAFSAGAFRGLESLPYLSINTAGDSTLIGEIQAVLPRTTINENLGVCLGSGYLLLIIPAFLVLYLALITIRWIKS
jgi:hypothetical protein